MPGCPKIHLGFVDVRDVASLHILAMQNDAANGHRFIASEREFWFKEVCALFRDDGYLKAPTKELPNWVLKMMGFFNPEIRQLSSFVGKEMVTASNKPKKILGWKPRYAAESLKETAQQLADKRLVPKQSKRT